MIAAAAKGGFYCQYKFVSYKTAQECCYNDTLKLLIKWLTHMPIVVIANAMYWNQKSELWKSEHAMNQSMLTIIINLLLLYYVYCHPYFDSEYHYMWIESYYTIL